ncbi:DUF4251 domain-containing protein [Catalinimonas niigatensis]|uniref:DUF4251 domain-containing protein n=1 Tax=Catalinimonas niigatensis TaxID=1397264 RepID=UPI0026654705|nr:DUF4251 domain-containing protein [Catalinimonas niigatensis]WPP52764.1 DUF4251 domain-containing protein [Catalinimonas niigatensis]
MKNIHIIITTVLLFFFVGTVSAQTREDRREARKQERLEKKRLQAEAIEQGKTMALNLAQNRTLVLEADALYDRYMNRYNMVSNSFIMFDGDRVVIQTAAPGYIGYNGLGGITLNGRLTDYEVSEGKEDKPVRISAQVSTTALGHGTLNMTISGDGSARATFRDNWGNRVTFSGQVNSLDDSVIYEGMSIFG